MIFKLYIDFSKYKASKELVIRATAKKLTKRSKKIEKKHDVKCFVYFENEDVLVFEVDGKEMPEDIMKELRDWFGLEVSEQDLKRLGWKDKAIMIFKKRVSKNVRKAAMASLKMLGIKISYEILD